MRETVEAAVREEADLSGADLFYTNLSGADLSGADGVTFHIIQIQGSRNWVTTLPDGRVAIGCKIHTIEEWIANAEEIGQANNYSEIQIREYQIYLQAVNEVIALYKEES